MFNSIGVGEIVVIAVIALIVMGPEKFPEFAKIAMRAFRDVRGYVDDIKKEMANELNPVKREINQLARYKPEEYIDKLASAITAAVEDDPQPKPNSAQEGQKPAETVSAESSPDTPPPQEPYKYED
ncbi:MAG: Sec-independent protein translocase protein TatB [Candidatus Hydrogenedentes bacterium]|nr:Sec-independent protein translocase protein TatB [Candidatus Hydrogenedentota bacterium]